jgi:hypothetical protein
LTGAETRDELVELERRFWASAGDREGYGQHLAPDALHVFPGLGIVDRRNVLDGVAAAEPWQRVALDEPLLVLLDAGSAALVYRAVARRADGADYVAAITSVYRKDAAGWQLVLHQQTPLTPRRADADEPPGGIR